jgi:hypothetical protein
VRASPFERASVTLKSEQEGEEEATSERAVVAQKR